jgi:hypothetical protein
MGRSKMLLDGPVNLCLACAPPALAGVFTTPTEAEVDVDDAMDSGGMPSIYLLSIESLATPSHGKCCDTANSIFTPQPLWGL